MCIKKEKDFTLRGDVERIINEILKSKIKEANLFFATNFYTEEEINELKFLVDRADLKICIKQDSLFTKIRIYKV